MNLIYQIYYLLDILLYIYTSGTTGLPKPGIIKQSRFIGAGFSFFDLALQYNRGFVSKSFDLLYILENYKPIDKNIKSKFTIFQGHHGCKNAEKADIIIPCSSSFNSLHLA